MGHARISQSGRKLRDPLVLSADTLTVDPTAGSVVLDCAQPMRISKTGTGYCQIGPFRPFSSACCGGCSLAYVQLHRVLPDQSPGDQSQFSAVLAAQASDVEGRFSAPHAWIIENIGNDLRIETLAEKAGMTPRIFARTYVSRTGMTPANGVDALWMETARLLLESRQIGCVVEVAKRAGFGDDERMRRAFLRHLGVSPTEYRNRFSGP
jgi:AraC-like DNA-binding protein